MKIKRKNRVVGMVAALAMGFSSWASASDCENLVSAIDGDASAVTTSSDYSSDYPGWQAFDGDRRSMWISSPYDTPAWIAYRFNSAKKVDSYSIDFVNGYLTSRAPKDFELQGLRDGIWETLDRRTDETGWKGSEKRSYSVARPGLYEEYRLLVEDDNDDRDGVVAVSMGELALEACSCHYGTELVPKLHQNTPSVNASGSYSNDYPAWKAFDSKPASMWISRVGETPAWVGYEWENPRFVDQYSITYANGSITTRSPKIWELQGWNGTSWVTVDSRRDQINWSGSETRSYTVQSPGSYAKYRLHIEDDNDDRDGIVVISMGNLSLRGCQL